MMPCRSSTPGFGSRAGCAAAAHRATSAAHDEQRPRKTTTRARAHDRQTNRILLSNKSFQFSERRRARPTAPRRGGNGGGRGHDRDHDRDRDRTRDRDRARDTRHHTATPRRRRRLRARLAALERSTSGAIPPAAAIASWFAALLAARFRSARAACSCAPGAPLLTSSTSGAAPPMSRCVRLSVRVRGVHAGAFD